MSPQRIPDSRLEDDLQRLADELDRIPRARDINLYGEFTADDRFWDFVVQTEQSLCFLGIGSTSSIGSVSIRLVAVSLDEWTSTSVLGVTLVTHR